jgi:hypothetical protein
MHRFAALPTIIACPLFCQLVKLSAFFIFRMATYTGRYSVFIRNNTFILLLQGATSDASSQAVASGIAFVAAAAAAVLL